MNGLARARQFQSARARPFAARNAPVTVISPHLDDAVLSCSQLLSAHPGSTVITVFAGRPPDGRRSWWDKKCFRPDQDPMTVRQKEDLEALRALAATPVQLPFCDAAYETSHSIEEITEVLAQYLDGLAPESVLVPLGILHSDHIATQRAATRLIRDRPHIRWIIYEELPYRFQFREFREAQKRELQHDGFRLVDLSLPRDPSKTAKLRSIRRYRSQLKGLGWNKILQSLRDEQYWQVSPMEEAATQSVPKDLLELKGYLGDAYDDLRVTNHRVAPQAPHGDDTPCRSGDADADTALYDLTAAAIGSASGPYRSALRRIVPPPARLLDYGCGVGSDGLRFLAEGYEVAFADYENPSTRYLRWRLEGRHVNSPVFDIEGEVPGGFDAVFAFDLMNQVQEPFALLATLEQSARVVAVNLLEEPFDPRRADMQLPIADLIAHARWQGLLYYHRFYGRSHLLIYRSAGGVQLARQLRSHALMLGAASSRLSVCNRSSADKERGLTCRLRSRATNVAARVGDLNVKSVVHVGERSGAGGEPDKDFSRHVGFHAERVGAVH